jgi:uncharacterized membrane protein
MTNEDAIVRLLTELRDMQREETVWRHKVTEQSMQMQRAGVRTQRIALFVFALMVAGVFAWWAYLSRPREVRFEEPDDPRIHLEH